MIICYHILFVVLLFRALPHISIQICLLVSYCFLSLTNIEIAKYVILYAFHKFFYNRM